MALFCLLWLLLNILCSSGMKTRLQKVSDLRRMLDGNELITMPCCYDGLTARLVENAGFELTFMTGFGVSSTYGVPDVGLLGAQEMFQSAATICNCLHNIPCIGDGDTGYGNPLNVKRTVMQYAQAGMAGIMIEDQVMPKRCGHTKGKQVVDRDEAYRRIKAACDARDEGADIIILARTDSRGTHDLEEALERCKMFRMIGADMTFLEAPQSEEEMRRYCKEVDGPKLANMLEGGLTPILSPTQLKEIGYTGVAAYPLTLLSASVKAMNQALALLKSGERTDDLILPFKDLQAEVGFEEYYKDLHKYL